MGSLNALNARPHDDGFLNPCRRTSKVFCKTHLGLREEHAAPAKKKKKSEGVKARPPRLSHPPWRRIARKALAGLSALVYRQVSSKWTEKTKKKAVLGNV